jgi:hypothetical protein
MSVIVEAGQFSLEKGKLRTFSRVGEAGLSVEGAFCGDCGTRVYHRLERMPSTLNVKAGTLDDTNALRPAIHVWVSSRQSWFELPPDAPRFDRNPGDPQKA